MLNDQPMTLDAFALAAGGSDRGVSRDNLLRVGFLSGHMRGFVHDAPTAEATRIVWIYLYIYRDAELIGDEAKRMPTSVSEVTIGEPIGDDARAYELRRTTSYNVALTDFVLGTRYGNAVITVDVQGLTSQVRITEAIDIAKRQLRLLSADTERVLSPSPTPRTSRLGGGLSNYVLEYTDLPSGYLPGNAGTLSATYLASQTASIDAATRFLQSVGYRNGYGRAFTRKAEERPITVSSVVLLHADSAAAERAFMQWVVFGFLQGGQEVSIGERIGDQSIGRELRGYATSASGEQQEVTWVTVYFRYGDAVSWVKLESLTGTVDSTLAADLARKQFERQRTY